MGIIESKSYYLKDILVYLNALNALNGGDKSNQAPQVVFEIYQSGDLVILSDGAEGYNVKNDFIAVND